MQFYKKVTLLEYGFALRPQVASEMLFYFPSRNRPRRGYCESTSHSISPHMRRYSCRPLSYSCWGQLFELRKNLLTGQGKSSFNPVCVNAQEWKQGSFKVDLACLFPNVHTVVKPLPLKPEISLCPDGSQSSSQDDPPLCLTGNAEPCLRPWVTQCWWLQGARLGLRETQAAETEGSHAKSQHSSVPSPEQELRKCHAGP